MSVQEIIIYSKVTMGKPTKLPYMRVYLHMRVGTEEVFKHTKITICQSPIPTQHKHKRKTMAREKIVAKK